MISPEKQRNGLLALNWILIASRSLAYEGNTRDLAVILDMAEYLPLLMLEPEDRTAEFRAQLVDFAQRYPQLALPVERFDAG